MFAIANPEPEKNPPVTRQDLKSWRQSIYQYEFQGAIEAGFTVGSVKLEGEYKLLVIDTARTATVVSGDAVQTWGCGYRLLVEVNKVEAVGSLNLPVIAAKVELGEAEASVRLEVNGWSGDDMWGELPAPQPLNVNSYREFLDTAGRIQKLFGRHPESSTPVKLAEGKVQSVAAGGVTQLEAREAVAATIMLNLVSEGATTEEMARAVLSHSDLSEGEAMLLAQGLYMSLEDGDPTGGRRREIASSLLEPLRRSGFRLP